jgi:hypothetical protein
MFVVTFGCNQAGGFPEPQLVHYNPKDFDFGKKKAFPLRDQAWHPSLHRIPLVCFTADALVFMSRY